MSSRMRKHEQVRLELTRGDWLIVKKYLTAGEHRRMLAGMLNGASIEPINVGLSRILAYLIDWSITDANDKPVGILDQPREFIAAALDELDPPDFREILTAIETHEAAMDETREQEKKLRDGVSTSLPISPSVNASIGDMSGSSHLTEMSIASS